MRTSLIVLVTLALIVPALGTVVAAPDPNPNVDTWIVAKFDLNYTTLTTIRLTGSLDVHQYTDGSRSYSAKEVADQYNQARQFGGSTSQTFVTNLEKAMFDQVESTLAAAFPLAVSRVVDPVKVDEASLTATRVDDFDPAVRVAISATIERSLDNLGLTGFSQDAIDAAFAAGALVTTSFFLNTDAGYLTTYNIVPPPGLVFATSTEADTIKDGGRLMSVVRDNTLGDSALRIPVTATLDNPTGIPPTEELVDSHIDIHLGEISEGATAIPITAQVVFDVRAISIADGFPGVLPDSVVLTHISADGIRALYQTGAITDDQIKAAETTLLKSIKENLTNSMGPDATITGGFATGTLATAVTTPYSTENGLRFEAQAAGERVLEGDAGENFDLALSIGALIDLDMTFNPGSGDSTYTLHAPPGIAFDEANGGTVAEDGASVTFVTNALSGAIPATITMRDAYAPAYKTALANLAVTVDLKDLDIQIGKAINGDLGKLLIDVTVKGNLAVVEVPEDLKASFDPRVRLNFLSSDAIRLLLDSGLMTQADLGKLEAQLLEEMAKGLTSALGQQVDVVGGFDPATLLASLVADPPTGDKPIVFLATASLEQSLNPAAGAPAAIALYTTTMPFEFPRVEGIDTLYTIILPKGLAVTDVQIEGGKSETGKSADGRDQFTVTPEGDSAKATVSMAVTPAFVVAKFLPIVILAIVIVLLIIGTPIAIIVAKKKKGKA